MLFTTCMPGLAFTHLHTDEKVRTQGLSWRKLEEAWAAAVEISKTMRDVIKNRDWFRAQVRSYRGTRFWSPRRDPSHNVQFVSKTEPVSDVVTMVTST